MSNHIPLETVHEVRDTCLCLAVQRAARVLARRFDRAFQPFGLTNGQFSLMMALNGPRSPTVGQLAIFLAMDRTTLTAALKSLERRSLVTSETDEKDRRNRRLQITDAGRALLLAALPVWRSEHAALDAELGGDRPDQLRTGLRALAEGGNAP
ncbi:MAG: MarR family transcriptional regulator [Rhizobiales bacterium PAR1]|nr:MAG: MarR family transcriptional regulator [Rhizobiales bacterium PAR1]